jgi:competence protein ComEC
LGIFIGLWRKKAFWLAMVGIVFFVLMIGSPASAVRAAIMGVLLLWATKSGRLSDSFRAIVLAAAVMLFFSPFILLYDAGFQLSFLAALSIVLIYGPLSEKMEIKNDFLELKSIFWITISVQLGVLGILIYSFESFSVISLLANLIILPLIPFIMLGGFSVILISFISMFLAKLISIPFALALFFEIKVIEYLAKIPWSIIEIENVGIVWLVAFYLFFVGLVVSLRRKK